VFLIMMVMVVVMMMVLVREHQVVHEAQEKLKRGPQGCLGGGVLEGGDGLGQGRG